MRGASRVTLFIQDPSGHTDAVPDMELVHALLSQVPMINRNPDGSRTLVFDLRDPAVLLEGGRAARLRQACPEQVRAHLSGLGHAARELGLKLTASLAESAEIVAETELSELQPQRLAG